MLDDFLRCQPQRHHMRGTRVPAQDDYAVEAVAHQFSEHIPRHHPQSLKLDAYGSWEVSASVADAMPKRRRYQTPRPLGNFHSDVFRLDAVRAQRKVVTMFLNAANGKDDNCARLRSSSGFFSAEIIQPHVTLLLRIGFNDFHILFLTVFL
jgi:hypothetical protein